MATNVDIGSHNQSLDVTLKLETYSLNRASQSSHFITLSFKKFLVGLRKYMNSFDGYR